MVCRRHPGPKKKKKMLKIPIKKIWHFGLFQKLCALVIQVLHFFQFFTRELEGFGSCFVVLVVQKVRPL
jgi:hypothetical protein